MNSNEHYYEACYLAWQNGKNPDRISHDLSDRDWDMGRSPEYTAGRLVREDNERRYRVQHEENYYDQMAQQDYPEPPPPPEPPTHSSPTDNLPF